MRDCVVKFIVKLQEWVSYGSLFPPLNKKGNCDLLSQLTCLIIAWYKLAILRTYQSPPPSQNFFLFLSRNCESRNNLFFFIIQWRKQASIVSGTIYTKKRLLHSFGNCCWFNASEQSWCLCCISQYHRKAEGTWGILSGFPLVHIGTSTNAGWEQTLFTLKTRISQTEMNS